MSSTVTALFRPAVTSRRIPLELLFHNLRLNPRAVLGGGAPSAQPECKKAGQPAPGSPIPLTVLSFRHGTCYRPIDDSVCNRAFTYFFETTPLQARHQMPPGNWGVQQIPGGTKPGRNPYRTGGGNTCFHGQAPRTRFGGHVLLTAVSVEPL